MLLGMDGNLEFPLPSMNRLNQTEPAIFLILTFYVFFMDSLLLYILSFVGAPQNLKS
jgi:hypothetical protein